MNRCIRDMLMVLFVGISIVCFLAPGARADSVVNINAYSDQVRHWTGFSDLNNGYKLDLNAGTYTVTPIRGQYTAWYNGNGGWLSIYDLYSPAFGYMEVLSTYDPIYKYWFPNADLAFAAANPTSFTLSTAASVYFGVADSYYGDNSSGMSLLVSGSPVPIPAAAWLLGSGLIGLIGLRRKMRG